MIKAVKQFVSIMVSNTTFTSVSSRGDLIRKIGDRTKYSMGITTFIEEFQIFKYAAIPG
jgi:hypothetical protein